jgi:DNA-binding NarL/FixJ family response regulator
MDQSRPIRVFLTETSHEIRKRMNAALAEHNMQVIGGGVTVDDCVAAILRLRPDVVVLDVVLDDGTGLQVMNRVHTLCNDVCFVVCTNHAERQYRDRYLAGGARAFLDKSTETDRLPAAIAAACGR